MLERRRLKQLIDGRLQAADPAPPLLSSADSSWCGFPLERAVFHEGGAESIAFLDTELILVTRGSIHVEYRAHGCTKAFLARRGTVTVWPADHESRPAAWTAPRSDAGATEMLRVQLDPSVLEGLGLPQAAEVPLRNLSQQSGVDDAVLASLMGLMETEVAAGCPTGRFYGQSLSLALASHLAERSSGASVESGLPERLASPAIKRVLHYIRANLGQDLTVTELARVASLSPHHFSVRFKAAVGMAPHQWLTRERVREAERLLRARRMCIAEVALAVGFANQSHFTDVFRRFTGTTPKRFQRDH